MCKTGGEESVNSMSTLISTIRQWHGVDLRLVTRDTINMARKMGDGLISHSLHYGMTACVCVCVCVDVLMCRPLITPYAQLLCMYVCTSVRVNMCMCVCLIIICTQALVECLKGGFHRHGAISGAFVVLSTSVTLMTVCV